MFQRSGGVVQNIKGLENTKLCNGIGVYLKISITGEVEQLLLKVC